MASFWRSRHCNLKNGNHLLTLIHNNHTMKMDEKKRLAFKMKLKPGCEEEYRRRHAALWPEMRDVLKKSKVGNYSIFYDPDTMTLFAYQEAEEDTSSQDLGADPIVRKWWHYMSDIMEVNEDESPVSISLRQLFFME